MRFIIVLILLLSGCATTEIAPQQAAGEHPRFIELERQLQEGRITDVEYARKGLALSRELYPHATEKQALWAYAVVVNGQAERGEITKDMADYLLTERTAQYRRERDTRLRQQYQQQQGGGVTASDLLMLDMLRRPFNRMQAPINCHSRTVGGAQYTDCY